MKQFTWVLTIVIIICVLFGSAPVLTGAYLYMRIRQIFPYAQITFGKVKIEGFGLMIYHFSLNDNSQLMLDIPQLSFNTSPNDLMHGQLSRLYLSNGILRISYPKSKLSQVRDIQLILHPKASGNTSPVQILQIEHLNIDINSNDLKLLGNISFEADLQSKTIKSIAGEIDKATSQNFSILKAQLSAPAENGNSKNTGLLNVKQLSFNKLIIQNLRSQTHLDKNSLSFDLLVADTLNGSIQGTMSLNSIFPTTTCELNLMIFKWDIEQLIHDFELNKKLSMSGYAAGRLYLKFQANTLKELSGNLSLDEQGGTLIIHDQAFLDNLAKNTHVPKDLIVDSFKNYHYNSGKINLFLENKAIQANAKFSGSNGNRDFTFVYHFN